MAPSRGRRLEARAERVLELVVAARAARAPRRSRARCARRGARARRPRARARRDGDDRQRKALVDDQALDARVAPQLLQIAGRIAAQALEARRADGLVGRLAAELLAQAREQRERERRARRRAARARPRRSRDRRPRSARTCRASSPAAAKPSAGAVEQLGRAPAVQVGVDDGRVGEVDHDREATDIRPAADQLERRAARVVSARR